MGEHTAIERLKVADIKEGAVFKRDGYVFHVDHIAGNSVYISAKHGRKKQLIRMRLLSVVRSFNRGPKGTKKPG